MIFQAIDTIRAELIAGGVPAGLGNIGEILAGNDNNTADESIIISLVNIEENRVSRDPQNYLRNGTGIQMKNPAIHLYLTLLFTSVRQDGGYGKALESIQHIIEFFQRKQVFDHTNVVTFLDAGIEKLILDMISLNLEQLHQLWSMIGGKYHPSVVYRMRMVTIDSVSTVPGSLITEINAGFSIK